MSDYLIYLIGHASDRGVGGPIKCGISRGPWGRIKALQTGSPRSLEMLAIFHVNDRATALSIEAQFHESMAGSRMSGEWFDINPTDAVGELCTCIASHYMARLEGEALHRRLVESGTLRAMERVARNRGELQ